MSREQMVAAAAEAISNELDNGDYGDASGHLGGDGIRFLAAAVVDAVLDVLGPPF